MSDKLGKLIAASIFDYQPPLTNLRSSIGFIPNLPERNADGTMDLLRCAGGGYWFVGMPVVIDQSVPVDTIIFEHNGKEAGRIVIC